MFSHDGISQLAADVEALKPDVPGIAVVFRLLDVLAHPTVRQR
jgi:hypothetical protein